MTGHPGGCRRRRRVRRLEGEPTRLGCPFCASSDIRRDQHHSNEDRRDAIYRCYDCRARFRL